LTGHKKSHIVIYITQGEVVVVKNFEGVFFMKKYCLSALLILFVCIFNSCASVGSLNYPQPAFDKPFVYVIDASSTGGSYEDYVKLHNRSTDSNIIFNVYVHHPKSNEWVAYGTGVLKGPGDTDTIDSNIDDIDDYRYFAIESTNGKNYKYIIYKSRDDLHISIMDDQGP
jgi:hypothetical protein